MSNPELLASTPADSPHISGDQPDLLHDIVNPGVNLCLWQRPSQPAIVEELFTLPALALPDVRCMTSLKSFDNDVSTLLQQQDLDPSAFENWRIDLRRVAEHYFSISKSRNVTMRLVTTNEDDCPRFHVDQTQLRLLCTYRGPGTEWLNDQQVDRAAQRSGAPNEEIIRYGEPNVFEPFWVGIMKGNAYPGNAGQGLVHRSPQISGSGKTRVLFCLDS
ncbi:MAG: DUF1826 domain-containing protein [Candidatus Thiodiazotropha taylori]|uniref:DUF1826 domain-containing protein n=1 Tax=Candidatus Thiodiazotropha taylori TaxID=2792791 RepID=A0A9E4U581_9GAMM|nr:DUF1826 domain-containing protein [Candidatus Thiodiazotropha taylori]MCG8028049.1 DUF1826 domain-containing protein [Candidatus Thiodiazotropha taylori]MCG8108591.1 DUF1826 domain-containing protein [Candidatus Thiodiazotropha taylori]MCG8112419.1 DUF1826 domain-containing protein [Candidatus Thiodiazotropha taylori]MCG8123723.1 DUF1826 domain-containing protein [Candidatus Thiodiazotropha taylori]